jgi:hypothetical protein
VRDRDVPSKTPAIDTQPLPLPIGNHISVSLPTTKKKRAALLIGTTQNISKRNDMHTRAYNAWRRAESFQIPVTEEGLQQAEQRHQWFLRGFEAGVRCAAEHLELKHKEVKDTTRAHNLYLVASRFVRELYQEEKV